MITPSYSLTATERVLPRLALDFTTASLDPRVTFTRTGDTATVINSSGVIVGVNADIPRFEFDPVTLVCRGLLIEEARTNVLLNSLIDGTSLATQSVTVTAAARTLSFYGTGQIVLSGAHSATVTGTGAYPTRTSFTFTPSAGTLTLTVTGTVQFAQLEAGAFPTSYIPTEATAATRNADVATMTGTNFSDWFNATEGAFETVSVLPHTIPSGQFPCLLQIAGTAGNSQSIYQFLSAGSNRFSYDGSVSGAPQWGVGATSNTFNVAANVTAKYCGAYKANSIAGAVNGVSPVTDATATIPTVTSATIGSARGATQFWNGYIREIYYWPQRITNAEVQAFSK
jgi:hypothetical protein